MAEYRTAARPSPGLGRDFVNECERFVAVVAAIRSALHLPALSRMSKQRNLNAEEFALCEAADSVILEAVAERPEQALRPLPDLAAVADQHGVWSRGDGGVYRPTELDGVKLPLRAGKAVPLRRTIAYGLGHFGPPTFRWYRARRGSQRFGGIGAHQQAR